MQTQGALEGEALYDLLAEISRRRETGILTVQGENDIVAVTLLAGRVVAADGMNETMEEGLGQVLASQGLVSPEKFGEVVSEQQDSGQRVPEILLEKKLVGQRQLLDALRLQTYRVMLELLRWRQGEYNLFLGEEISYEDGIEAIAIEELLMRSIQDLGSAGPLSGSAPDLDAIYERNRGDVRPIKVLGEHGEGPSAEPTSAWVSRDESQILNSIDGQTPGSAMLESLNLSDYQVMFGLYRLSEMGLVQPKRRRAPSTAPADGPVAVPTTSPPKDQKSQFDQASAVSFPEPPQLPQVAPMAAARTPSRKEKEESLSVVGSVWVSRSLAFVLAVLLVSVVSVPASRNAVFFPLAWQNAERLEFEAGQRTVTFIKIARAVDVYYLLYGRYPEELGILVDMQLLSPSDLYDPRGRWLDYSLGETGYRLEPLEGGESVPGLDTAREVSGNFLLNPQFVALERQPSRRALRLLD